MNTVLVVAAGWHDEIPGGANRLPTEFARYLARLGQPITYLCAGTDRHPLSPVDIDGVKVWRYPPPAAPSPSVANLYAHVMASWGIARMIRARGPIRAVLGHSPLQYLGAVAGCGAGARRCYAVHSPFAGELKANHEGSVTLRHRLAWGVAALLEFMICSRSDLIHCDSFYSLGLMRTLYPGALRSKGVVLPGWLDTDRFTPATVSAPDMRARLGPPWDPAARTFFTLRRLTPRMGLDALLEAAAILAGEGHRFRVMIGGAGPQRGELQARVQALGLGPHVGFLGRITEASLVDSFRAADCFVLPTRALECFGLIILESYACGVPVIGVPVGSIPEVMGEELHDWLAEDNSAAGLADKMRAFLAQELRPDRHQVRARALQFSFRTMSARHRQLLLPERGLEDALGLPLLKHPANP